jgi:hypothetical protein
MAVLANPRVGDIIAWSFFAKRLTNVVFPALSNPNTAIVIELGRNRDREHPIGIITAFLP